MNIHSKIKKTLALLNKAYGKPAPLVLSDPVDELVRTILSQNTNDRNSLAAFAVLKKRFRTWEELLKTDTRTVARLIWHAGLVNIKAKRIKGVLAEIKAREGRLNLANLTRLDTQDALEYMESLKGVGPKTAACVLLFSFGKPVMPVDTHIFRVTNRLGLISGNINISQAHERLSAIVPKPLTLRHRSGSSPDHLSKDLIYNFHLCIIEHGRRTCKAQGPRCGSCVIYGLCAFKKKRFFRKKELCR